MVSVSLLDSSQCRHRGLDLNGLEGRIMGDFVILGVADLVFILLGYSL